jgi:hypothetical protein
MDNYYKRSDTSPANGKDCAPPPWAVSLLRHWAKAGRRLSGASLFHFSRP